MICQGCYNAHHWFGRSRIGPEFLHCKLPCKANMAGLQMVLQVGSHLLSPKDHSLLQRIPGSSPQMDGTFATLFVLLPCWLLFFLSAMHWYIIYLLYAILLFIYHCFSFMLSVLFYDPIFIEGQQMPLSPKNCFFSLSLWNHVQTQNATNHNPKLCPEEQYC